ncbi:MAG TPA: hypothetical protein VGN17_26130 [Bryobacteraceae bacterium]|jgi:hypothetical protein
MSVSRLIYLDGFEDYDLSGQGYNYYTSSSLTAYPGRGSKGAQGGASLTFEGELPTACIGFAYHLNDYIPAISMPALCGFSNNLTNFNFNLYHYDDNAAATAAVFSGGSSVIVTVTHGGSYYDQVPQVYLVNGQPGGSYTSIDVAVSGGQVISILVNGASGYDAAHPPSVFIAPGGRGFRVASSMLGTAEFGLPTANAIRPGQWNYFEFQAQATQLFDVFTGRYYAEVSYVLKVNGVTWLDSVLTTNENDLGQFDFNWATANFNTNVVGVFDDLYITDGEFLADGLFDNGQQGIQVKTLRPNGQGQYSDFTPSDPTKQNWEMVDDVQPDGDETTVSSNAALKLDGSPVQDSYTLQQLSPIYQDIRGCQTDFYVKKSNAGPCKVQGLRMSGGGAFVLGTWYPSLGNYDAFFAPMRFKVSATPWTRDDINGFEIGLRKAP